MKYPIKMLLVIVYILFILVAFLLPLYSFEGYSIISNTTSHLGAQGSPNAWVMNLTFITLGLASIFVVILSKVRFHQVIGSIFGISLILTGIFQHGSFIEGYTSNLFEDQLHSIFATMTGISFVFLAFGHGFMSHGKQRLLGFSLGLVAS